MFNIQCPSSLRSLCCSTVTPQAELQRALESQNVTEVTRLIAEKRIDLSQPMPNKDLPLNFAVREKKTALIFMLLEAGANPGQLDDQGLSAIDYASLAKDQNMMARLLQPIIGTDLNETLALLQNPASHKNLLKIVKEANDLKNFKFANLSPAHKAAATGNIEKMTALLEKDGVPTVLLTYKQGFLPLHAAILGKQPEMVRFLLDKNPDQPGFVTKKGDTPLHLAALAGNGEVYRMISGHSRCRDQVNATNFQNLTPLHYAGTQQNVGLMHDLVKKGADCRSLSDDGAKPLALLGAPSFKKDPLRQEWLSGVMFVTLLGLAAAKYIKDSDWSEGLVSSVQSDFCRAFYTYTGGNFKDIQNCNNGDFQTVGHHMSNFLNPLAERTYFISLAMSCSSWMGTLGSLVVPTVATYFSPTTPLSSPLNALVMRIGYHGFGVDLSHKLGKNIFPAEMQEYVSFAALGISVGIQAWMAYKTVKTMWSVIASSRRNSSLGQFRALKNSIVQLVLGSQSVTSHAKAFYRDAGTLGIAGVSSLQSAAIAAQACSSHAKSEACFQTAFKLSATCFANPQAAECEAANSVFLSYENCRDHPKEDACLEKAIIAKDACLTNPASTNCHETRSDYLKYAKRGRDLITEALSFKITPKTELFYNKHHDLRTRCGGKQGRDFDTTACIDAHEAFEAVIRGRPSKVMSTAEARELLGITAKNDLTCKQVNKAYQKYRLSQRIDLETAKCDQAKDKAVGSCKSLSDAVAKNACQTKASEAREECVAPHSAKAVEADSAKITLKTDLKCKTVKKAAILEDVPEVETETPGDDQPEVDTETPCDDQSEHQTSNSTL